LAKGKIYFYSKDMSSNTRKLFSKKLKTRRKKYSIAIL